MTIYEEFENIFKILSNKSFLSMEGLGNEVPFFIHAYDIKYQKAIYSGLHQLIRRLEVEKGLEIILIGLYDMVIQYFKDSGDLEELFMLEQDTPKSDLIEEFASMINPENVIIPYFNTKMTESNPAIVVIYQIGEVYPYLRTHDILNQLQSTIKGVPMVTFFPGEYVMSKEFGFHLNLFSKFPGPYYRAFRLDDYLIRGNFK